MFNIFKKNEHQISDKEFWDNEYHHKKALYAFKVHLAWFGLPYLFILASGFMYFVEFMKPSVANVSSLLIGNLMGGIMALLGQAFFTDKEHKKDKLDKKKEDVQTEKL